MTITLNSLSGRLLLSILLMSFSGVWSCSLVWNVFFCLLILPASLFLLLVLGMPATSLSLEGTALCRQYHMEPRSTILSGHQTGAQVPPLCGLVSLRALVGQQLQCRGGYRCHPSQL